MFEYSHSRNKQYISRSCDLYTSIKRFLNYFDDIDFIVANAGGYYGNNSSLSIKFDRLYEIEKLIDWLDINKEDLKNFKSFGFSLTKENIRVNVNINATPDNSCSVSILVNSDNKNNLILILNQIERDKHRLNIENISNKQIINYKEDKKIFRIYALQDNIACDDFFKIIEEIRKDILGQDVSLRGDYQHTENPDLTYSFGDDKKLEYIKSNWNSLASVSITLSDRDNSLTVNQHFERKSLNLSIRTEAKKDIQLVIEKAENKFKQQIARKQDIREIRKSLNGTTKEYLLTESISFKAAKNIIRCFDTFQVQDSYFRGKCEIDNNTAQYEFNDFLKWQLYLKKNFNRITTFSFYSFAPDRNINLKCVVSKGLIKLNIETLGDYEEKFEQFSESLNNNRIKHFLLDSNYKTIKCIRHYNLNSALQAKLSFRNAIKKIIKESCSKNINQKYLLKTAFICADRSARYSSYKHYRTTDNFLDNIKEDRQIAFAHIVLEELLGYELGISLDAIKQNLIFTTVIPEDPEYEVLEFNKILDIFKVEFKKNDIELTSLDSPSSNSEKKESSSQIEKKPKILDKISSFISNNINTLAPLSLLTGTSAVGLGIWHFFLPPTSIRFVFPFELANNQIHIFQNTEEVLVDWYVCRFKVTGMQRYVESSEAEVSYKNALRPDSEFKPVEVISNDDDSESARLKNLEENGEYIVKVNIKKPLSTSKTLRFRLTNSKEEQVNSPVKYSGCSSTSQSNLAETKE